MDAAPASASANFFRPEPVPYRSYSGRIILLEGAYALAYGAVQSATFGFLTRMADAGTSRSPYFYWFVHSVLFTVAVFGGGWLGDRYLGARRAVMIGGTCVLLSPLIVLATAIAYDFAPPQAPVSAMSWGMLAAMCSAMSAGIFGSALMRANLPVVLGGRYAADAAGRLPAFAWFELASSTGFILSNFRGEWGLSDAFVLPSTAALLAAALVLFARTAFDGLPETPAPQLPPLTAVRWRRLVAGPSVLALVLAGGILATGVVSQSVWWNVPVVAVCLGMVAFLLRLAYPRTAGDDRPISARVRSLLMILAAAVALSTVGDLTTDQTLAATTGQSLLPTQLVRAVPLPGILIAIAILLRWRGLRPDPARGARLAAGVSFTLLAAAFFAIAALPYYSAPENSFFAVLVVSGCADTLFSVASLHAVTAVARPEFAGRMVAAWRLSASAGFRVSAVLSGFASTPDPSWVVTVAMICVLFALVFAPEAGRRGRNDTGPKPVRSRLHRHAIRIAAVTTVATTVWAVVGRDETTDLTAFAASTPPKFLGADGAFLPADSTRGFVQIRHGLANIGVDPGVNVSAPREESPAHLVSMPTFWIGRYEVTIAQYRQCVDEGGCKTPDFRALRGADTAPVRYVTWYQALDYCAWLERKLTDWTTFGGSNSHVTLPSEAEWERAARGEGRMYPWSGPLTAERASYANSGHLEPVGVGEFGAGASPNGINDLAGNVAEWTRSEYRRYPYDPNDGREDMRSGANTRVIRGGSFYDSATLLRVTARQAADPLRGYDSVGFRIAITSAAADASSPAAVK